MERRIIGVWLGLLLLVLLVASAWYSGGSRLRDAGATGPWIGMPPGGSDLADWQTRKIVEQMIRMGSPDADLLLGCGQAQGLGKEIYVASLTNGAGADAWRIVLQASNEEIVADASREAFQPPPPPGSPVGRRAAHQDVLRHMRRSDLGEIRDAWRVSSLWGDDPGKPLSREGNPVRLEACIDGRYAIRTQPADKMGARLHAAFVHALSLPAEPVPTDPR